MGSTEQQVDDAVAKRHIQNTDSALGSQSADLDMNLHKVIGLKDPTGDRDGAHKKYVDDNSGGGGDVTGPGSAIDSAIPLFDGITGKLLKDSARLIEDVLSDGSDIPDGHAIKTYGDANWSSGGYTNLTEFVSQTAWRLFYSNAVGDVTELALGTSGQYLKANGVGAVPTWSVPGGAGNVVGPATNTDNYVPQWNGADSKTLKNGFPITAAGKALIDDANITAQRATLGLLSAALRNAEDVLTNGSNLPDGAAIKTYGDANWGGHTNLTQFVDQNAWKLFYSDIAGDVTELALGTNGQYLKANGVAAAPTWDTPVSGDFSDGGEAGGANRTLGNTDNFSLGFKTNNLTRLAIGGSGHATMSSGLDVCLLGTGQFKMAGGVYAMTTGGADFRVLSTDSTVTCANSYGLRKSLWSFFATDVDDVDEMLIELNVIQTSGAAQRAKTGMKISHYSMPDNGGDVSGLLSLETGGGSAITCYKAHTLRPGGYTNYQDSVQGALECGTSDQSQAGLFMSGMTTWGDHTNAAECIWCRIDNEESKGILVTPNDNVFNARQAFAVGTINRNSSVDGNLKFLVKLDGTIMTVNDIAMNNTKAISIKNNAGVYKNMLTFQSDDTLRLGWGLGAGKLMLNIDGGLKTLFIDGNGFVKAA